MKCVFNCFLSRYKLLQSLISFGNLFHSSAPATLIDRAANVFLLVCFIFSLWTMSLDLIDLLHRGAASKSSCRYAGADFSTTHLYIIVRTFNKIRCLTGSQCNWNLASVALSYFPLPTTTLAAMSWICCSLLISLSGR